MDDNKAVIDRVFDVLQGQDVGIWLRAGVAVSAIALGYMGEEIRPAFDQAISREARWFAESARQKAMARKALN
jgi:hypothetical protein